jgi:pilus assembly protein CpaC
VETEVELDSGQSFVIAGLLDRQTTESFSKVPGIGSLPVLGKLFQSKSVTRNHTELLILITPEVVRPIPAGQPLPGVEGREVRPSFDVNSTVRQPGLDKTGPVPVHPPLDSVPIEKFLEPPKKIPPVSPVPAAIPGSGS